MKIPSSALSGLPRREHGVTMVFALITIMVLSLAAANVLFTVNHKYASIYQASSWQEALLAAEAAGDLAMVEFRANLPVMDPSNEPETRDPDDARVVNFVHQGEGNRDLRAEVSWDAPFAEPRSGFSWFRVRAEGTAGVAGPARVVGDARDNVLRRLSLITDRRTGERLDSSAISVQDRPKAVRVLELMVRPASAFENAISARDNIHFNNHNIEIVSFVSDPDHPDYGNSSYSDLQSASHEDKLDYHMWSNVATNGTLLDAGSANIYGDGLTNQGEVKDGDNIHGEERHDFYMEMPSIQPPQWSSVEPTPETIHSSNVTRLEGSDSGDPARYKLSRIHVAGTEQLLLANPDGSSESHMEIWVTGDLQITGRGQIVMEPGVNVVLYFEGDVDLSGRGFLNPDPNQARRLQLYGIEPPEGVTREVNIAGNAGFTGAVYAPDHTISMKGGGASESVVGSFVGKHVFMNGTTSVRYDRSLAREGIVTDYKIAGWMEDYRN